MRTSQAAAAQLDVAIDGILRSPAVPLALDDGDLVATARLLRDALPRFHPRFSFEEHLASRFAGLRPAPQEAATVEPSPLRAINDPHPGEPPQAESDRRRRGLVAGGAIASGVSLAIPIAGAALVVWRRSRSSGGLL